MNAATTRFNRAEYALTFDVESTYGVHYGRTSNPFCPDTGLCCQGWQHNGEAPEHAYFVREESRADYLRRCISEGLSEDTAPLRIGDHNLKPLPFREETTVLVGANIKFDMLWQLTRSALAPEVWAFLQRGGWLWDISYAEYLLSGQTINNKNHDPRYRCSLNSCATLNGIATQKLDVVKGMWEEGIRTEDIPEDVLLEYQDGDVSLTYEVYKRQVVRAKAFGPKFYNNLCARMDGLLATMWMEFNGLHVDVERGLAVAADLQIEVDLLIADVATHLPELPEHYEFNVGSRQQLSSFLFGGPVKYTGRVPRTDTETGRTIYNKVEVPVWATHKIVQEHVLDKDGVPYIFTKGKNAGTFKMKNVKHPIAPGVKQARYVAGKNKGQLKTQMVESAEAGAQMKNGDMYFLFTGFGYNPLEKYRSKDEDTPHQFSTAEDHLKELRKLYPDWSLLDLIDILSSKLKDLGTYFITYTKEGKAKGMLTTVGPDGKIHHSLQHYITATGRLSCSKPKHVGLVKLY